MHKNKHTTPLVVLACILKHSEKTKENLKIAVKDTAKIIAESLILSAIPLTLAILGSLGLMSLNDPKKANFFPNMKYIDYAAMIVAAFALSLIILFAKNRYKNDKKRTEIAEILKEDKKDLKREKIKNWSVGLLIVAGSALMMIIGKMGMVYYEYFLHTPSSKNNLIFMMLLLLSTIIIVCFMFCSSKKTHAMEDKLNYKIIKQRINDAKIGNDRQRRTAPASKKHLALSFIEIMIIKIVATIAFAEMLTPEVFANLPGLNKLDKNLCFFAFVIAIGLTFGLILRDIAYEYNAKLDLLDGGTEKIESFKGKTKQFFSENSPLIVGMPAIILAVGLVCIGADGAFLSKISEKFKIFPRLEHNINQAGFITMFVAGLSIAVIILGVCIFKHKQIDERLANARLTKEFNYGLKI